MGRFSRRNHDRGTVQKAGRFLGENGASGDGHAMNHGDGKVKATTWTQLADEVESDGDYACEALAELERRLLDLRMAHKCDNPLKHIP